MSKRDEELMLLHDGELSEREARAAEERAAASPEDRARLEALRQVGDVLRARLDLAVEEATPRLEGLWSKIEAELEPARPRRPVVEEQEHGGFFGWLQAARGYFLTGAVCAAAGVVLTLWLRAPETKIVISEVPVVVETAAPEPVLRAENADAEVESLEVVGGTGTVFHIPSATEDEAPTTVIWVTRDEPGPEGPI